MEKHACIFDSDEFHFFIIEAGTKAVSNLFSIDTYSDCHLNSQVRDMFELLSFHV